jgi:hypothetical protein
LNVCVVARTRNIILYVDFQPCVVASCSVVSIDLASAMDISLGIPLPYYFSILQALVATAKMTQRNSILFDVASVFMFSLYHFKQTYKHCG